MKILQKTSDVLDKVCGALIVVMLAGMVICTTAQIVCRTWFTALEWAEEVTRFLLIWSTYLGATCVYRHSGNIAISFVQDIMPDNVKKGMRVLVHAVCFALFLVVLYFGVMYCAKQNRTAAVLPIKMKYIYSCIPISMAICAFHAFVMTLEELFTGKVAKA